MCVCFSFSVCVGRVFYFVAHFLFHISAPKHPCSEPVVSKGQSIEEIVNAHVATIR